MNILITNDDGYCAAGLRKLAIALAAKHDVTVVAPERQSSGAGHMVNFFGGIAYEKADMPDGIPTYAVDGTPADCVIFAVRYLFANKKFDLVLSGINDVLNIGSDIIYSGTFGAAQEGTFQGIPSVALSLRTHGSEDYTFAVEFAVNNLEAFMRHANGEITVNVNIPSVRREDIVGVRVAPVAFRPYDESFVTDGVDDKGRDIYRVHGKPIRGIHAPDSDVALSENGYITISPVRLIPNDLDVVNAMAGTEFRL